MNLISMRWLEQERVADPPQQSCDHQANPDLSISQLRKTSHSSWSKFLYAALNWFGNISPCRQISRTTGISQIPRSGSLKSQLEIVEQRQVRSDKFSPQVSLKKKTWLELIEKRVETPRVKENPAEVTMRTVERRTKNAGSSLAYWAFVSLKRQWTIKLKFQCKSRRAYLSILEIAVDLLRSVEKVEHLEKGNYSKMVARQQCWPFATTCQSANSKSIWRKWNIRRRY